MTPYKIQYWLYAILNKNFGQSVEIKRSNLHSRYQVNRHDFFIEPNNLADLILIKNKLIENLSSWNKTDNDFLKMIDDKKFIISFVFNHENIAVSILSWKLAKKNIPYQWL